MDSGAQNQKANKRYLPPELNTQIKVVKLYQLTGDLQFVLRWYLISKASLMRWNKLYNGTKESLADKSHRPHSQHPNAHTEEELTWIRNYHRRNPNISICELYGKLRQEKAYSRHPGSLYRVFIYTYKEQSSYSTVDFVQRAIAYFGYAPDEIQTDNGSEFKHTRKTSLELFLLFCGLTSLTNEQVSSRDLQVLVRFVITLTILLTK